MLVIRNPETAQLLGWAETFGAESEAGALYVVTPYLALEYAPVLRLVAGHSYDQVFAGAHLYLGPSDEGGFQIVHAGFSLYQNGDPAVNDFACVVGRADLSGAITRTAEMLRCF